MYVNFKKEQTFPGRGNDINKTVFNLIPMCNVTAENKSQPIVWVSNF